MDGKAPAKPGKQKVTIQKARWKIPLLLTMCLLEVVSALKGPKLVSGEAGGEITIRCYYAPLSINRHQRKYWCRLKPPSWICRTIVSTNHYTDFHYHGRVTIEDHPQNGLFVVRLSQLSQDDMGHYRCGIGNENNILFFNINLIISPGSSNAIFPTRPLTGEQILQPFELTSSIITRQNPEIIQHIEGNKMEWDRIFLTLGTNKRIVSGTTPTESMWPLESSSISIASVYGSAEKNLDAPVGSSDTQVTPNQSLITSPPRPSRKQFSVKSTSQENKIISWILISISLVLFLIILVALILLQRRLQKKKISKETEREAEVALIKVTHFLELSFREHKLLHMERKTLQNESLPILTTLSQRGTLDSEVDR